MNYRLGFIVLFTAIVSAATIGLLAVYSEPLILPYVEEPIVDVDGVVSNEEYPVSFMDPETGLTLSWLHNGTDMYLAISGEIFGWLSFGYGSRNAGMDGSNIIIGSVISDSSLVLDEVGVGHNHFPDIDRGGESDIVKHAGTLNESTTLEFIIPLDSSDNLDYRLIPGEIYGFFLAVNQDQQDFSLFHTAFSETYEFQVELTPIPQQPQGINLGYIVPILSLITLIGFIYWMRNRPKVYRFSEM